MPVSTVDIMARLRELVKKAQLPQTPATGERFSSYISPEPRTEPPVIGNKPSPPETPRQRPSPPQPAPSPPSAIPQLPAGRAGVENMMKSAANALAESVKAGDAQKAVQIMRTVRTAYELLVKRYGEAWVKSVISDVLSSLPPYERKLLEYALQGKTANIFALRNLMLADEIARKLRQAGMNVSEQEVMNAIRQTGLDMRKIAQELRQGMEKVISEAMGKHSFSRDIADTIKKMRLMMAVAMGVNGEQAVKMLARAFSGTQKQVFNFLAKSALKPVPTKELVNQIKEVTKKARATAKTAEETIKAMKHVTLGNHGGQGGEEERKTKAMEYAEERMRRMFRHMNRGRK